MIRDNEQHTINFKCFHLLADSTLKQWGKEVLIDYIHTLYHNWESADIGYNSVINYAIELQKKLEHLEKRQSSQLTVEEIDYILNYPKEINIFKRASVFNKLRKQREMLKNEKNND